MPQRIPPYPTADLNSWARQIVQYLIEQDLFDKGQAEPIFLGHILDATYKAASDGILMFDPVQQRPVYSYGGEWRTFDVSANYDYQAADDAGDGSVAGDINATDFTGQDGAIGTCAQTDPNTGVTFYHKGVQYIYTGPRPASYGVGCSNTMLPEYITPVGVGSFISLDDTPASYAGAGNYFAKVNSAQSAIVFDPDAPSNNHEYARKNFGYTRAGVENHSASASYVFDDLVAYNGTIYHCTVNHSSQPFSLANWSPIAATTGAGVQFKYSWSSLTTGDPGPGGFAITNPISSVANTLRISDVTDQDNDVSIFWENADDGDIVMFVEDTGGAESGIWAISGAPVDNITYWSIPVTRVNNIGEPEDNRNGTVSFIVSPYNRLPVGGDADQRLVKTSSNNYDVEWRTSDRLRWRGTWLSGNTYHLDDVTLDGVYLMRANKETTDQPAPVPVSPQTWDLADVPNWGAVGAHVGHVQSGVEYQLAQLTGTHGVSIWVPDVGPNISYTVRIYTYPQGSPSDVQYTVVPQAGLVPNQWNLLAAHTRLYPADTVIGCVVDAVNSDTSASPPGTPANWVRGPDNNSADPINGDWNRNHTNTVLRISSTDASSNVLDLSVAIIGSTINVADVNDSTKYVTYVTTSNATNAAGVFSWSVAQQDQGSAGLPDVASQTLITIEAPVPALTEYVTLTGGNADRVLPNGVTARGLLSFDDVAEPHDNDLFGVRVNFQAYSSSEDWDVMAVSGGNSSTGGESGGATTFAALNDTPESYSGQGGKALAVTLAEDGVEFVTPPSGVTDHGLLNGLGDDDHSQYHTDARGDARYVNLTGDTMTGDLKLSGTVPALRFAFGDAVERGLLYLDSSDASLRVTQLDASGTYIGANVVFNQDLTSRFTQVQAYPFSAGWGTFTAQPGSDVDGCGYQLNGWWGAVKAGLFLDNTGKLSISAYDDAGVYLGDRVYWNNNDLTTLFGGNVSTATGYVYAGSTYLGPMQNSGARLRNLSGTDNTVFSDFGQATVIGGVGGPTGVGLLVYNAANSVYGVANFDTWVPVTAATKPAADGSIDLDAVAAAAQSNPSPMQQKIEDLETIIAELEARIIALESAP